MSQGWTYDSTSPITNAYVGCNLGNNTGSIYCNTSDFNLEGIPIGPGQRLVPGKYTLYISAKDAVTASNSETIKLYSNCGGFLQALTLPLTNVWPTTAAGVFTVPVDFTTVTGSSTCYLGLQFFGRDYGRPGADRLFCFCAGGGAVERADHQRHQHQWTGWHHRLRTVAGHWHPGRLHLPDPGVDRLTGSEPNLEPDHHHLGFDRRALPCRLLLCRRRVRVLHDHRQRNSAYAASRAGPIQPQRPVTIAGPL